MKSLLFHFRYDIMLSCWNIDCTKRPTFAVLANELSDILEADAGYVELGHQKRKNTSESVHYTPLITTGINRVVPQRYEEYDQIQGHMKEMYESEGYVMKDNMYEDVGGPVCESKNVV